MKKQYRPSEVAGNRRPDPGYEAVVTVAAEEKILRGGPVGSAGVEQREQFAGQHDQIDRHCDSNDLNQRSSWPGRCGIASGDSQDSHDKDDERGATDKRGCKKSWSQQCRIPEWSTPESAVQETQSQCEC